MPLNEDDFLDELDRDFGPRPMDERSGKRKGPAAGGGGELSEDALAEVFAHRHADDMRFDHHAGRWFKFDGQRWRRDEKAVAFHFARVIGRTASGGKKQECRASVAAAVERFAKSEPRLAVTSEVWDTDPLLLNTPGGTVDLRTGKLRAANPADMITKSTACVPAAGTPTLWLAFLNQASGGDPELVRFMQQWCGYCLTGLTVEHALLFVHGDGGTGKTVAVRTISKVLKEYAVTAGMDTFTASRGDKHPTDLAMLAGARLVTASETEEGRAWAEARVKQLTGGDEIAARFMHKDFFQYVPQFKLTIIGNHAPVLHNVDDAARRRFNIVPFTTKPAKPDRQLEEKLVAEYPQILAWMIKGCLDWQTAGLQRPQIVEATTAEYFTEQDVFGQWVNERCTLRPSSDCFEAAAKLYADWTAYALANGETPGTAKAFGGAMRKRGFAPKTRRLMAGIAKAYDGIELRATATRGGGS